jgi:hypothetical protein
MQRLFSSPLDEAVNFPLCPVTIRAEEKGTKSMHLERLRSARNKRRKISRKTKHVVSGFLIAPTLNRAPSWLMARLGSAGTSAAGDGPSRTARQWSPCRRPTSRWMAAAGLGYGALQRSPTTEVESATQVEARREESTKAQREETKRFEQIQGCGRHGIKSVTGGFHPNGLTLWTRLRVASARGGFWTGWLGSLHQWCVDDTIGFRG